MPMPNMSRPFWKENIYLQRGTIQNDSENTSFHSVRGFKLGKPSPPTRVLGASYPTTTPLVTQ